MNCTTDDTKLEAIRRIAQAHATPASNIGAHRLAVRILEIINHELEENEHDRNSPND